MPLRHVLYRCPLCGHDPTEGEGDTAFCPACGGSFARAARGVTVRWNGAERVEPVAALVDRIEAAGGCITAAADGEGRLRYASEAVSHGFLREHPVRRGGRLLGFKEEAGPGTAGVLELGGERLVFSGPQRGETWLLDELTSVQVSSRALQLGIRGRGTVQLTLPWASPLRWEGLLHHALRRVWAEQGRGDIAEFQPRIAGR